MNTSARIERWLGKRLPSPDKHRIAIVTGARQTGKTTLLKQTYPNLRYFNLDAFENREWLHSVSSFDWAQTVGPAVIDEAQKEPGVFEKIKFAFDAGTLSFSALSGSAQILLLGRVRETLAGRAFVFELWPLLFCELAAAATGQPLTAPLCAALATCPSLHTLLSPLRATLPPEQVLALESVQEHLLTWGGMPELLRLDEADRLEWLRSYEITYLERDLQDLARISDLTPFRKFQKIAALRSGKILSYSELAKDAGVSTETSRRYLEYLRLSYQAFSLPPYYANLTSQVVKTPKYYWTDLALLRHLSGQFRVVSGELFETFVVSELNKWVQSSGSTLRLFYYRTRSGLEADLLLETERGVIGMEIKARARVDASDAGTLRRIAAAAGDKWLGGLVVYAGQELQRLCDPDIWAVPTHRLFTGAA